MGKWLPALFPPRRSVQRQGLGKSIGRLCYQCQRTDCLLTFAPCPISTQFSSTNLSSKNKEPPPPKKNPSYCFSVTLDYAHRGFLPCFLLFWSKSEYWLEEGHDNLSSRSFLFICGSLGTTRPVWARAMFHSLSLPQSLAQYLTHSVPLLSVKSMKNWNDREESWEKCLAVTSECFSISVYPEHGLFWNLISQSRAEI